MNYECIARWCFVCNVTVSIIDFVCLQVWSRVTIEFAHCKSPHGREGNYSISLQFQFFLLPFALSSFFLLFFFLYHCFFRCFMDSFFPVLFLCSFSSWRNDWQWIWETKAIKFMLLPLLSLHTKYFDITQYGKTPKIVDETSPFCEVWSIKSCFLVEIWYTAAPPGI